MTLTSIMEPSFESSWKSRPCCVSGIMIVIRFASLIHAITSRISGARNYAKCLTHPQPVAGPTVGAKSVR